MTRVVYPSARLSANGAAALLDTVDHGLRVCDLPSARVRWNLGEDHDVTHASLSASGSAVAWIAENDRLTILTRTGETHAELPSPRERIRAVAVSDSGDLVAALIAAGGDEDTGGLFVIPSVSSAVIPIEERNPTQPKDAPQESQIPRQDRDEDSARADLPVYDTATLLANDECTLLAVESSGVVDGQHVSRAFRRDGDALRPLWTETAPAPHGALALSGDWLVAATADGLAAWHRTGEQATMPGTLRDRLIFSPDGSHLLAYAAKEVIDVTSVRILFRLIDVGSLTEVRRAIHLVEDRRGAQFALDAGLDLFDVRATRAGELVVTRLGWGGGAAVPT